MSKKSNIAVNKSPSFIFTEHENVAHYDWRLQFVSTVAQSSYGPEGTVVLAAGTPLVAVCPVEHDSKTHLRFNAPSVSALLLDHSHRLWLDSKNMLELFTEGEGTSERPRTVPEDGPLFELLERRMAAVVFAYTSIEAFANEVIEEAYVKQAYTYSVLHPKTGVVYVLEEIQRYMSLDEKLTGVLPEICNVKTIRGGALWQRYRALTKTRHFIIHPKLADTIQKAPDDEVLWKRLSDSKYRDYAKDAKDIMMHYASNGSHAARWLFKCPLW